MSRPVSDAAPLVVAALLVLGGCGPRATTRNIDLCAAQDGLAAALAGGRLQLTVQSAAGEPLVLADVAIDRASDVALTGAAAGDLVVVEGLDAGGAPVAFGSATLGATGGCVCLTRRDWHALATWTDGSGGTHFGPRAGFFVGAPPAGLVASTPLSLDRGHVAAGERVVASFAFTNTTATTLRVRALEILARPPGATHTQGLLTDFTPQNVGSLAPGAVYSAQATRTFTAADPAATWTLFARYVDALGAAHDGPELELVVGPSAEPLVPAEPLRLDKTWVAAGQSLHGHAVLQNRGAVAVTVPSAVLSARAPGDGDAAGRAYDFSNPQSGTVAPGASIDLAGDRPFGATEDPCAGVVCSVRDGQCQLVPAR
jgi:hypothetical protein